MADLSADPRLPEFRAVLRDARRYDASHVAASTFGRLAPLLTDIAMLVDVDGELIEVTPSAALLLGWAGPLGRGSGVLEVVHPEDVGDIELALGSTAPLDSRRLDIRLLDATGDYRWYEAILTDLSGVEDVAGIIVSLREIGTRVAAEADLARSESWLRALVSQATDAILVVDERARVAYASPAIERIIGVPATEVVGSKAIDLVVPSERGIVAMAIIEAAGTPASATFDCYVVHADDVARHVEVITTDLLGDPSVGGIVVNVRDLSERNAVSAAVDKSERRLRKLARSTSDTVALMSADGRLSYVSESPRPILDYPSDYWDDAELTEHLHPSDLDRAGHLRDRVLESPGLELTEEFRMLDSDGSWQDLEVTATNHLDDPDLEGVVLTTRLITPRKHFERALSAAHAQALDALAAQVEFVAKVGHEVRTPVHSIIGLAELLQESDLDDDDAGLVDALVHSGEALRLAVDDLLDFSRMKAGRLEVVERPFRPAELADDLSAMVLPQAEERGLSLMVDLDDSLPPEVMGDELRVRQVLINLLTNALKFTDQGSVALSVNVVGRESDRWRLLFSVSDTGVGIPADEVDSVFEPFVQATTTGDHGGPGTGLGLTICRQLVEVMGGQLDVRSEVGVGSEFSFVLPVLQVSDPGVEARWSDAGSSGGRVLVVEDSHVNRVLIERQLQHFGCASVVVDTADEAMGVLQGGDVDLVLVDLQLHDEEGLDLVRRQRACERQGRRTPMVVTTAAATDSVRDECTLAGVDDLLPKPVRLGDLYAALRRWISPPALVEDLEPEDRPVDAATLESLAADVGDPDIAVKVVETYLSELDGRVAALRSGVQTGDLETVRRSAHLLRSTSGVVGATVLSELCERVESAVDNPQGRLEGFADAIEAEAVEVARVLQIDLRNLVS